ncbi:MAG TPA: hypothetical protein VEL07_15245 [Planctomycetota bacterium]|nr:hypothetical protein [Planctomycetota bacterium]
MPGPSVAGSLVQVAVIVLVGWLAYGVFMPVVRHAVGRKRTRRSTLDRLERDSDQQSAVRIVVDDGDGRRLLGPFRLAGARPGAQGSTLLECIDDRGAVTLIDPTRIVAIAEV